MVTAPYPPVNVGSNTFMVNHVFYNHHDNGKVITIVGRVLNKSFFCLAVEKHLGPESCKAVAFILDP
jgi:hypothetical protein